jgi:hypothetical protein
MDATRVSPLLASLALAAGCTAHAAADAAPDPERAAVEATVQLYFQGHATGDGNYFRRAFHPDAFLFWVDKGALAKRSSGEFAAGATGKPAPDEAKRVRKILMVDIAGDAAIAKVDLAYPTMHFTDYLSLLKIDGKWTIIDKIFHRDPVPANAVPSQK